MENNKSSLEIIDEVKQFLTQLPNLTYGNNVLQYFSQGKYESGLVGFNALKKDFDDLDLTKSVEFADLDEKILKQKKEIKDLENKHTNLISLIGENSEGTEGSLARQILVNLKSEIDKLIETRNKLLEDININENLNEERIANQKNIETAQINDFKNRTSELENSYNKSEEELKSKYESEKLEIENKLKFETETASKKIQEAQNNANVTVKLINQFKDFLEETNKNMHLYSYVIIGILVAAIGAICFSIPNLLNIFESYETFIKLQGIKITNIQIINYALGLLIVKLLWALCLSAILTGMYSLLKGLLITYEKINQDKRNMSAIYAISGNVAIALNEYGVYLADDVEDPETGESYINIRVSTKELNQKKENIRWNQIMKYFEKMQNNKVGVQIIEEEDSTKLKLVTRLLNKFIDKIPKS
jgi:hypothetical protein